MEKQTKLSYQLVAAFFILAVLHNLVYGLLGMEEPFFFTLSLLSFLGFILSLFYNIFTYLKKGIPQDIWKLGWLGLLGLVGLLPRFGSEFYGLYGFFAFFGLKKR
jgi:hypothetical protein